jgi:LCP family protein required for cell wall assembly
MLLQVDIENHKVTGVSIPRDTKVRAADGLTGKINATLGRGGIDLLASAVEELTGIRPDHSVLLKADAVKNIVDAVGGVEVETIDEMHYDDYWGGLHVHLPKGRQRLNGEQAVGFTRFREVNTKKRLDNGRFVPIKVVHSKEEGDARRMARQQQLIRALAESAKAPSNWPKMGGIIDTAFGQLETTLSKKQLAALAQIFKGGEHNIKTATLMGGDENGEVYYFIPDIEKTKALVDWMFNDNEYAGRQLVRVAVYNGTKVKGAAKVTADKLEDLMYDAFSSGNSKEPAETSIVIYRTAAVESRARDLAKALGIAEVRKANEDDLKVEILGSVEPDVRVTIGADLAEQIVAARNPSSETPRLGG